MHRLSHFFERQVAMAISDNILAGFIHNPQIHAIAVFQHVIQKLIQRFHHPAFNITLFIAFSPLSFSSSRISCCRCCKLCCRLCIDRNSCSLGCSNCMYHNAFLLAPLPVLLSSNSPPSVIKCA